MYYVGIDIAKLNHFASVVSSDGEVLVKPFKFTNDNDGFCTLLSALASYDRSSLIIGLESTAHYADNLVEFLVSKRYQVCVINPIQASTMRKNNIRKTKTDKVDSRHRIYQWWNDPWRNRRHSSLLKALSAACFRRTGSFCISVWKFQCQPHKNVKTWLPNSPVCTDQRSSQCS